MSEKSNLTRRRFVAGSATGLIGASLAAPAIAQSNIEWRMVTSWPRDLPGPGVTARRLAERITKMSGGKLSIKLFSAGEFVPALEVFDAVGNDAAEMAHTAALFWQGKIAAAPFFTAFPFGLTPLEHISWIEHGGGQALWDELYAPFNVKPFMAGNTGSQMGGWYSKPIHSVEDLKGLKIRMPGLGGEVMNRLGAAAVTIAPSEILPALQSGAIDATEFLGPFSDMAMGFHRAVKHYYWPGFHEPNGTGEALISAKAWASLNDELKAIVENACQAENIYALAEAEWQNARALKQLKEEFQVDVREYPADVLKAAKKVSEEVLAEFEDKDKISAKIYKSAINARENLGDWSKVSQAAFLTAREQKDDF